MTPSTLIAIENTKLNGDVQQFLKEYLARFAQLFQDKTVVFNNRKDNTTVKYVFKQVVLKEFCIRRNTQYLEVDVLWRGYGRQDLVWNLELGTNEFWKHSTLCERIERILDSQCPEHIFELAGEVDEVSIFDDQF